MPTPPTPSTPSTPSTPPTPPTGRARSRSRATSVTVGSELAGRAPRRRRAPRPEVDVTVVLVAHDGAAWLPEVLSALEAQTVRPRRVVAVDTGSTDATPELLAGATGLDRVLTLGRRTGYATAVATALEDDPGSAFVWLLHDDSAPYPDALEALLDEAGTSPSAGLLGAKALDWHDPRRLVGLGVSTDRAGHRDTGLEPREWDQGQHDAVRDVLAVGTAGALVRRSAWDAVGGLDRALPLLRDDLDLGWRVTAAGSRVLLVPRARVRHVRAATTGRRSLDAVRGRATAVDRRHAQLVLAAHAPLWALPLHLVGLALGSLLRAVVLLLWRQPRGARDELAAAVGVLLRPDRLARARRLRSRSRTAPRSAVRQLLVPRRVRLRAHLAATGERLGASAAPARPAPVDELGGDAPEEFAVEPPASAVVAGLVWRPSVVLVVTLAALTAYVARELLPVGDGVLAGGRLLPAPDGARDLLGAYAASWHPTSVGSADAAPPFLAVLGGLSVLLLGKAWLAVDLLLLGSVPLAGLSAWWAARAVTRSPALRLWASLTWALLPVVTGASGVLAAGRLDLAAAQVALPLVALLAVRVLLLDPAGGGWWRAWGLGLLLSLTAAFLPVLWALVAALLLPAALVGLVLVRPLAASARRLLAVLVALGVPVALLLPWSVELLRDPDRALLGLGPVVVDAVPPGTTEPTWHLVLLSPGGLAVPEVLVPGGLLAAAALGVVRRSRGGLALGACLAAVAALAAAVLASRTDVVAPRADGRLDVWPGPALQVAAVLLLVAALVAGDGLRGRLSQRSFGPRHLVAAVVALAAALAPVGLAALWVLDPPEGQLSRDSRAALPAFAEAELRDDPRARVLALRPAADGSVSHSLTTGRGDRLGASETLPSQRQGDLLDGVVSDLLTPSGSSASGALATRAVRFVSLVGDPARTAELAAALDAQPRLTRRTRDGVLLWEVGAPATRLTVLAPAVGASALGGAAAPTDEQLRTQPPTALRSVAVPRGAAGRVLVLAEAADDGWRASVGGRPLAGTQAWGWASAWVLPPGGGRLELDRDQSDRRRVLVLQGGGLVVLLLLCVPSARRRRTVDELEPGA